MNVSEGGSMFQCGFCKRSYRRSDHLNRHVRSHTRTKPFKCTLCPKAFTRPDLLKRHVAVHEHKAKSGEILQVQDQSRRDRVSQACRPCALQHLRCSEEKPCRRCTNKGLDCTWNTDLDVNVSSTMLEAHIHEESFHSQGSSIENHIQEHHLDCAESQQENLGCELSEQLPQSEYSKEPVQELLTPSTTQPTESSDTFFGNNMDDYPFQFLDLNLFSGEWHSTEDFSLDIATSFDINGLGYSCLDEYNPGSDANMNNILNYSNTGANCSGATGSDPSQPAAICAEAFHNSHWRFRPNPEDHAGAEEHHLSLPPRMEDSALLLSNLDSTPIFSCNRLDVTARDGIIAMITNNCHPDNMAKAVACFPSTELLNKLLQNFLQSAQSRASALLHGPTFSPNKCIPELTAAAVAYGAVLTSDPVLSRVGYAIQECVRVAIPKHWEHDNTTVRDLELSQAFLIILEIGLWSGYSRKVEIAESLFPPLVNMLRRGGKFKRSGHVDEIGDCQGAILRRKWLDWVEFESFKRLVFRILAHDTNTSIALSVNPLISYAEVMLPLPSPHEIWRAASPEQWKLAVTTYSMHKSLSVADCMGNLDEIGSYNNPDDRFIASSAVLSCAWALVWDLSQVSSFQRLCSEIQDSITPATRLDGLGKLFERFRLGFDIHTPTCPEVTMRIELTTLHLYMPFSDIQLFAGMEGPGQARMVYPRIVDWVSSAMARRAVFHAGQIIRAARYLPRGSIHGSRAVMLFHASLAFWVYGLLCDQELTPEKVNGPRVHMDDCGGLSLQRFTQFGHGQPCLRSIATPDVGENDCVSVDLSKPEKVIGIVMNTIRASFGIQPMPHLTEKLLQLMRELQRSSERRIV